MVYDLYFPDSELDMLENCCDEAVMLAHHLEALF